MESRRPTSFSVISANFRWDILAFFMGISSLAWAVLSLWGQGFLSYTALEYPYWPSASLGILTLVLATMPGAVLLRAAARIMGSLGLLIGIFEIAALWTALRLFH